MNEKNDGSSVFSDKMRRNIVVAMLTLLSAVVTSFIMSRLQLQWNMIEYIAVLYAGTIVGFTFSHKVMVAYYND